MFAGRRPCDRETTAIERVESQGFVSIWIPPRLSSVSILRVRWCVSMNRTSAVDATGSTTSPLARESIKPRGSHMKVINLADYAHFGPEKMKKNNIFQIPRFFCDLYCFEPGQEQKGHV